MQLVIAEKPSVAQAIAKVIGASSRKDGYIEGEDYVVSWCVGHLVGLASADVYNPKYSHWIREDLPIMPDVWQFVVSERTKKQFNTLKSLMERPDVSELVEATDAGREGELIFRLTYNQAGCKKPFRRLWISSMEDSAIRKGFENLLDGKNYDTLYYAALCRAKADWLVGINGTRFFTTIYGGRTLNVGRVMTPTLALLTGRETAIAGFRKEKFYMVELDCGTFRAASERINSKPAAEKLRQACLGKTAGVQSVSRKEKSEKAPKLYDLTTLQREANRIYGYTAQQTLDCAQLLYEKKLVTYPRTDSRYLTGDIAKGLPELCRFVSSSLPFDSRFSGSVDAEQVINDSKVSDHHAIIPTMEISKVDFASIPTSERNILYLLSVRLLLSVCPDRYIYADTEAALDCAGAVFTAKGREELADGWKAIEKAFTNTLKEKSKEEKKEPPLPEIEEGQILTPSGYELKEGSTSPPKRFTEDSLLSAMENAGSEEFDAIEDAERKGLGTPATRANIIEKLVKGGFAERKNKQLIPTDRGMELIKILPDTIKSAKLTAEWEAKLKKIEQGKYAPDDFMEGIQTLVKDMVNKYDGISIGTSGVLTDSGKEVIGKCPRCGKNVYEGEKSFYCEGYRDEPKCGFALWKNNKFFSSKKVTLDKKAAKALLNKGKIKMNNLFSEKKGVIYTATILLDDTGGKYVNFKMEFE